MTSANPTTPPTHAQTAVPALRALRLAARASAWALAAAGAWSAASSAHAQAAEPVGGGALTLASFNMGWWASNAQNAELLSQCNAATRQWCDTRYADTWVGNAAAAACEPTSPGLPPCNAFAVFDSVGSSRTATTTALQVPTRAFFAARARAMQATLRRVDADVFALQEISGVAAAREAFGNLAGQFSFCESDNVPSDALAAQKLVFAWRNTLSGSCKTDASVAVEDEPTADGTRRRVRPALVATLAVPGAKPISFINVHLKSGCASPSGDGFYSFGGDYLDSERPACKTLRRQVAPLEQLMKALTANGAQAVAMGDFNRKLDFEQNFRAGHARAPAGGRCGVALKREEKSFNPAGIPAPSDTVCLMWPELTDADGATASYTLLRRHARAEGQRCSRNEGLDHISISESLRKNLRFVPQTEEVDLATFAYQKEAASDHCPLRTTLKFR